MSFDVKNKNNLNLYKILIMMSSMSSSHLMFRIYEKDSFYRAMTNLIPMFVYIDLDILKYITPNITWKGKPFVYRNCYLTKKLVLYVLHLFNI